MEVDHIPGAHIPAVRRRARAGIPGAVAHILVVHRPLKGIIEGISKAASQVDTVALRKFVLRLNSCFKKLKTASAAMGVDPILGAHILAVRRRVRVGTPGAVAHILVVHLPLKGIIEGTLKAASQVDTVAPRKFVL